MAADWSIAITVGGEDISDKLTGQVVIDAEESQARIAQFSYLYQGLIDIAEIVGKKVIIKCSYSGLETTYFTGSVDHVDIKLSHQIISLRCSDDLQKSLDEKSTGEIQQLLGGYHSKDIFSKEPTNWDYAKNILTTVPKALDKNMAGQLQVTPWAAKANPDWQLTADDLIDQTPEIEYANWQDIIHLVEVNFNCRYIREFERRISVGWQYPGGFTAYLKKSSEVVTQEMLDSALNGLGWEISSVQSKPIPPSGRYGDDYFVNNYHPSLLEGFSATLVKHWSQTITENIPAWVLGTQSPTNQVRVISGGLDIIDHIQVENQAETKTSNLQVNTKSDEIKRPIKTAMNFAKNNQGQVNKYGDHYIDYSDIPANTYRCNEVMRILFAQARVLILQSNRKNYITFTTPIKTIDLQHTVKLDVKTNNLNITAKGKVVSTSTVLDITNGTAVTTVKLAISRGFGGTETLLSESGEVYFPHRPDPNSYFDDVVQHKTTYNLPTQLGGGDNKAAKYDADRDGFSGNYSNTDGDYPYRLKINLEGIDDKLVQPLETYQHYPTKSTVVPSDEFVCRLGDSNE